MRTNTLLSMVGLTVLLLTACSKNDDNNSTPVADTRAYSVETNGNIIAVRNLQADTIIGISPIGQPYGLGRYTFFSLENKMKVANIDSASSKWDIGFRGTSIILNGGTSGPANAGAFVFNGTYDDLKEVPADSVFRIDAAPAAYAIPTGSNKGWYNYNGLTVLVTPLPGKVMVIRTATGKYAKLEILNYYRGGSTPSASATDSIKTVDQRFYTFRYTYQPNGTKKF